MKGGVKSSQKQQKQQKKAEECFPPLSTSLQAFLKGGSDREFRDLIYGVLSVSTLMLRARERFGAFIGVTAPQYSLMVAIGEAGESTATQLAEKLHVSVPFVTAEVGKLIKRQIIQRRPNSADGRSLLLTLTKKGEGLIRHLGPYRRLGNDMIFGSLTRERAAELQKIIGLLLADADKTLHELDSPTWTSLALPPDDIIENNSSNGNRLRRRKA